MEGGLRWPETLPYILAQIIGGIGRTILAHAMLALPLVSISHRIRGD
jgi:glycerol uptake facilitator-like aquaporin